jgi:hypothetical protein
MTRTRLAAVVLGRGAAVLAAGLLARPAAERGAPEPGALFKERPAPPGATGPPAGPGSPALRGIVVDAAGAPVAGAEVAAAGDGDPRPSRAVAGADGRFVLPVAEADAEYLVGARAPGLAPDLAGGARPGGADLRLVLRPAVRVLGCVRDGEGRPCAGARVRATLRVPGVGKPLGGMEVRADEEGRFEFAGLPPVEGSLEAAWRGDSSGAQAFAPAEGAREARVDLVVAAGPFLAGTVRDREGRPLAGVHVTARAEGAAGSRWAESDAGGAFRIGGLDPVSHVLRAADPAGRHLEATLERLVAPRSGIDVVLEADPGAPGTYAFRAAAPDGSAPRSLRVLEFAGGEAPPAGSRTDAPDPDGVVRSAQKRAGRYRLLLRAGDDRAAVGEFAVEHGRETDLGTVRLAPGAALRGRLLAEDGLPAAESLLLAGEDPLPEAGLPDAEGRFRIGGLAPGTGTLRVLHPRADPIEIPWTAGAGETADLGDLRLSPAGGTLRVLLRADASGVPAGAVVRIGRDGVLGAASLPREAAVGLEGAVTFERVPAGTWRTTVSVPDRERPGFSRGAASAVVALAAGERREVEVPVR